MKFNKSIQEKLSSYKKAQRALVANDDKCLVHPRRNNHGWLNGQRACNTCFDKWLSK